MNQPAEPAKNLKVLLVEDDSASQKLIQALFEKIKDAHLVVASDAAEAKKALLEEKYDLIFMDIGLPDISGLEIAQQIRAGEKGSSNHILIVALTGSDDPNMKQQCISAGMDGYMTKPYDRQKILDFVKRLRK